MSLLNRMAEELEYATVVFAEACDCGRCGPCKRVPQMEALIEEARSANTD